MIKINEQIFVDNSLIYDYYGNLKDVLNIWTSVSQADITMMGVFLESGFRVVGSGISSTTKGNISKDEILKAVEGDDLSSKNLGNYLDANFVIVGKAVAKGVAGLGGSLQKSARANVNIRVIDAKTGEILTVESGNATASAIDELSAGVEAIKMASKDIAQKIIKKLSK
jgi:curli biogenesis system outer membrane secretion channel CsgG